MAAAAAPLTPRIAAAALLDLGFLAVSDLPDRPGPAYLLVALRERPTRRHYDPELVEYWRTEHDRGTRGVITRKTRLPLTSRFAWGLIRIRDRLDATNEYLTFGGTLTADREGTDVIAVFSSPDPLLRRGGHSQRLDPGAASVGAWFGRLLLAVDDVPGFEALLAGAEPLVGYAAFLADSVIRFRASPQLQSAYPDLWALLGAEQRRVRSDAPLAWQVGQELRTIVASGDPTPRCVGGVPLAAAR